MVRIAAVQGYTGAEILRYASLAEQDSEHPLGKAICKAWKARGGGEEPVSDFRMQAGAGVEALVSGVRVRVSRCREEDLPPALFDAAKR